MNVLSIFINALFLREDAYVRMREMNRALLIGLVLIVVLALVISVLALVGDVVAVAVGPDMDAIKDAVWEGMVIMPWYSELPRDVRYQIQQQYDMGWQISPLLFGAPNPLSKFFDLVVRPLVYLADWLIFGIIAFLLAKFVFKGKGQFTAFLGTLALAVAPQTLHLVLLIPSAEVDGLLVNVWSLCCAYLAIKVSFELPVAKAFWTTLVTWLLSLIPFLLVSGFFGLIVGGVQMALSGLPF